jgi:hypothetical protein
MKRFFSSLALLFATLSVWSQAQEPSICPVVEDDYGPRVNALLMDKLQQIAAPEGTPVVDDSETFYLSAQLTTIEKQQTMGAPSRMAARVLISLSVYSLKNAPLDDESLHFETQNERTLFASYSKELTGLGADEEQARADAIRKFSTSSREVLSFIRQGRERIMSYKRIWR